MSVITGRLAETLGNNVKTGVEVIGITRDGGDWHISTGAGPVVHRQPRCACDLGAARVADDT